MKILFITNYHQLYGANRSLLSILEKFKAKGIEVCLLLPKEGDYSRELEKKGIEKMVIPYYSQICYYKLTWPYLALPILTLGTMAIMPYLIYRISRFKPDLIYSNNTAENLGIMIARVLGVKHISHIREFMDLDLDRFFIGGVKRKKRYIMKSDGVVYVTNAVAKHVLLGDQLPVNHRVIYNGVKMPNLPLVHKELKKEINLGIVGLLYPGKGQDLAIKYMVKIKDLYPGALLHIWGDREGSFKKKILNMVADLGLADKVIFHGFEKDPNVIYGNMDVLMMCSRAEGFGRVTIEAMSRGIPVLGYKSGGTVELVKDGYNGYSFLTDDEFLRGFTQLFSSEEHYNTIAKQAYYDAHLNYSEDKYTDNVYEFVNEIMANG